MGKLLKFEVFNFGLMFIIRLLPSIFTIFIGLYLANNIDKFQYGHYVYLLTIGLVTVDVIGKISVQAVLRYANNYVDRKDYLMTFLLSYSVIGGFIVILVLSFFGQFAIAFYIAGRIFIINFASFFQAFSKINRFSIILFIESFFQFLALVIGVNYFKILKAETYFIMFSIVSFMTFLFCIYCNNLLNFTKYKELLLEMINDQEFLKLMLSFGLKISVWFIFSNLLIQGDKFVLKWFYEVEDLAQYNVAYMFYFGGINLVFVPIISYFHPKIMIVLNHDNPESYREVKVQWLKIVAGLTICSVVVIVLGIDKHIYQMLAPNFQYLTNLNLYLIIVGILWNIAMLAQKKREHKNDIKSLFYLLGWALLAYIIGCLFIILLGISWIYIVPIKIVALCVYLFLL